MYINEHSDLDFSFELFVINEVDNNRTKSILVSHQWKCFTETIGDVESFSSLKSICAALFLANIFARRFERNETLCESDKQLWFFSMQKTLTAKCLKTGHLQAVKSVILIFLVIFLIYFFNLMQQIHGTFWQVLLFVKLVVLMTETASFSVDYNRQLCFWTKIMLRFWWKVKKIPASIFCSSGCLNLKVEQKNSNPVSSEKRPMSIQCNCKLSLDLHLSYLSRFFSEDWTP